LAIAPTDPEMPIGGLAVLAEYLFGKFIFRSNANVVASVDRSGIQRPPTSHPPHEDGTDLGAAFRKDNGTAIRRACAEFVVLCRQMRLFTESVVAIDGSKFKAVNNRHRNFTDKKIKSRLEHLEKAVQHYLDDLDRADRDPSLVPQERVSQLKEKIAAIRTEMRKLRGIKKSCPRARGSSH